MKYIQAAAAFMICLVLSLPVYSSTVFAQTTGLTNVNVKGSDGYEGFVRNRDDTFTFSARACISEGVEVKKEQVRLWGNSNSSGFPFSSCAAVGDGCSYDCAFSRTMSDYSNICPSYDFDINLYKDSLWFDDKDAEAVCDTTAPLITVSMDKLIIGSGSSIKFTYIITDKACSSCNGCVGIKNAVFSRGSYTKSIDINTAANTCVYSSTLEEPVSSFSEGEASLQVTVYDNFGQNYTRTLSPFTVDTTKPSISLGSFEIKDISSNSINYFTAQTVKLSFSINITDEMPDSSSVFADLSSIGGSNIVSPDSCNQEEGSIQCSYNDIQYYLNTSSFSKTITVNASDTAGNSKKQSITLSKSFAVDTTAPSISGLRFTDASGNDIKDKWLGDSSFNARVYINITEAEIGLEQSAVYANLLELNPSQSSYANKPKDGCEVLTSSVTRCWFDIVVYVNSSGSVDKNLVFNAADLAGNSATETLTLSGVFKKDSEQPLIDGLKFTDASGNDIKDKWLGGDSFSAYVYVNITEAGIGLEQNTVFANLLELNPKQSSYASKPKDICETLTSNVTRCRFDVVVEVNTSGNTDKTLGFNASDKAGNKASEEITLSGVFNRDITPPVMSGLSITDTYNRELNNWTNGSSFNAYVYINITETEIGLEQSAVYANLLELNPWQSSYSSKPKDSCEVLNANVTRCRFDIVINANSSGQFSKSMDFNATDKAGNKGASTFSYSFKVDKTKPKFNSIETAHKNSSSYSFIGSPGTTITAAITETESGISYENVFIDLSSIGGISKKQADNCTGSSSGWSCYWYNVMPSVADGVYAIKNNLDTADNVGNKANESFEVNITVDTTGPVLKSINVTAVAATNEVIGYYITIGNAMGISITVIEKNGLSSAFGDFSLAISNATNEAASCSNSGENWTCVWSTGEIDLKEYTETFLNFNFTDVAGNTLHHSEPIVILGVINETADYWQAVVGDPSPSAIDKELINYFDPVMWFPVKLESKEGKTSEEAWPLYLNLNDCSGDDLVYISSAKNNLPELFNYNGAEPGILPYNSYLRFTMDRAIPGHSLEINCTLITKTLIDNKTVSMSEIENVSFEIKYYNNPLGTMDGRIKEEIKRVQDSWLVSAKWIETLKKIMDYAKLLCSLLNRIHQFIIAYGYFIDGVEAACKWYPLICPLKGAAGTTHSAIKTSLSGYWSNIGNNFCKAINCQLFEITWDKTGDNRNILQKWYDFAKTTSGSKQGYFGNIDPQGSIIMSAVFMCLPGIIYNLQKARVIDCMYINCLKQTKYGMPLYLCTYQRAYAYCKFVWGEIFNLIPFAAAISTIGKNILKALSHPAEMIGFVMSMVCSQTCIQPGMSGCSVCTIAEWVNWGLDILCDLGIGAGHCRPIWDRLTVDDSVCKNALKEDDY